MTVEYRDETPFTGDNHTPTELANAIRTKKYGKDVREPIAQSVERLNGVTNKIDNFNENLRKTFDVDADYVSLSLTSGEYIDTSTGLGTLANTKTDSGARHSSKLSVSEGEIYYVYSRNYYDGRCVVLVDDENKIIESFPSAADNNIYHLEINIPAGATGMYVNSTNNTYPFVTKFENYVAKKNVVQREVTSRFVFLPVNYTEKQGFYWSNENGLKSDDSAVTVDTPIKVLPGEIFRISGQNYYQGKLFLVFDEKRNLISNFAPENNLTYNNIVFQIPVGGQFLVVSGYETAPTLEKWNGVISEINDGKKWEAIGDSWTAKNTLGVNVKNYTDYVSEALGVTVINRGVGGSGFLADNSGQTTSFVTRSYSDDSDVYTFFGSFNDAYVSGKTLGVISDSNGNTLYGAIKHAIDSVVSANPKAKIGLIAPAPWGNINPQNSNVLGAWSMPANEFAEKYVKTIEDVAKLYGLPFLDMYHESAMRPYDENFLSLFYHGTSETDTTHPNTEGHKFFAPQIADFIKKIL